MATAIGVNDNRITVEMLPFQKAENSDIASAFENQKNVLEDAKNSSLIRTAIMAGTALIVVILLIATIRTFRKKEGKVKKTQNANGKKGIEVVADEQLIPQPASVSADLNGNINLKSENVEQLEKYIDKSPDAVAQLLRNWISDDLKR